MFIYNSGKHISAVRYKSGKRTKLGVIRGKGVKVSTSRAKGKSVVKKIRKIKRLRAENIKFLKDLGYKVN